MNLMPRNGQAPSDPAPGSEAQLRDPVWEEIPVALRGYVDWPDEKVKPVSKDIGPWPFYLFFDCETLTDRSQRLRVGSYIWCQDKHQAEKGYFYDPDVLRPGEIRTLINYASQHEYDLCTKEEFVDEILLGMAYALGARIVGFNLPFDISRLVETDPKRAKGRMRGGFSYQLRSQPWIPRIRTRHISRRLSFIEFTGVYRGRSTRAMRKRKKKRAPPRGGYFIDLKTLGGALLASNFSLDGLAKALGITERKLETTEHGRLLSVPYLKYAVRDVEVTAECFWRLQARFEALGLKSITLETAYSEASIGKAHFRDMGIKPFREVQPDFPKELLGIAMSTFYGGRSEVHVRRVISQIAYTDFLSMYPSVFVLMGLFRWVISNGVDWRDATQETQEFLATLTLEKLLSKDTWPHLTVLCQVELDDDIIPVRAPYGDDEEKAENNTIGLNRAKSDCPLWYTLADCVVSTILNGHPPRILQALRFIPREMQDGLKPLCILQNPHYFIDPTQHDFFKRMIELRDATKTKARDSIGPLKHQLDIEQNSLKTTANSTGYGIFAQFISETLGAKHLATCYGPNGPFGINTSKRERPGDFFHPLLATFVTGAARLMLAIAERLAIDAGLDWAFCDTDSMAFVKPTAMTSDHFYACVSIVIDQFAKLNPYDFGGSLLKLEDENYVSCEGGKKLHPLYVLPISAKRYVMLNIDQQNQPIERKASTHGVGQYLAPYDEKHAPPSVPAPVYELKDVDRWEHDLWYLIADAALNGSLDGLDLSGLPGFNKPAACQYSATSYDRWGWFKRHNAAQPPEKRVRPGNFLLTFQARPPAETQPIRLVLRDGKGGKSRLHKPKPVHPVAPFDRDPAKAAKQVFDRETGKPVAGADLLTYAEVFRDYARHAESKFLNGGPLDSGRTERRRIFIKAENIVLIGKESNEYEEEIEDSDATDLLANYGSLPTADQPGTIAAMAAQRGFQNLADQAGVSRQTVSAAAHNKARLSRDTLRRIQRAARTLKSESGPDASAILAAARDAIARGDFTLRELARRLKQDSSNLSKMLSGKRKATRSLLSKLRTMLAGDSP